jgi:hypothetical protein
MFAISDSAHNAPTVRLASGQNFMNKITIVLALTALLDVCDSKNPFMEDEPDPRFRKFSL